MHLSIYNATKQSYLCIVYLCKYFPRSRAFSRMRADYRVYAYKSRQSGAVASACAFLAYTGAHQVENIYKDGLYYLFTTKVFTHILLYHVFKQSTVVVLQNLLLQ